MSAPAAATAARAWLAVAGALALAGCGHPMTRTCAAGPAEAKHDRGAAGEAAVVDPSAGGVLRKAAPARPGAHRKMVLLLDFSGSMYPGYGKPKVEQCEVCAGGTIGGRTQRNGQPYYVASPEFQQFLSRWLAAAIPPTQQVDLELLLFNRRLWRLGETGVEPFAAGARLPFDHTFGSGSVDLLAARLRQLPENPYKVDPDAPNETDTPSALRRVVEGLQGDEILWLVTDNIVDKGSGGSPLDDRDARLTADFYKLLDSEPRVQMISAYPIFQAATCSWMCGTSLFVYGLYVSPFERPPHGEFHLLGGTTPEGGGPSADGWLWNSGLHDLAARNSGRIAAGGRADLAGVPLRLKPIDAEVLAITMAGHEGEPAVECDSGAEFGKPVLCRARLRIRNVLRHQTVEAATLQLSNELLLPAAAPAGPTVPWASPICPDTMTVSGWAIHGGSRHPGDEPIRVGPLAPLAESDLDVEFQLPAVDVDTTIRPTLFTVAFTNRILLQGTIRAAIHDVATRLAIDIHGFESVYGAAQLPEIFLHRQASSAEASFPIAAEVANDGQLLALLSVLGGGTLAALVTLIVLRFQKKQFTVSVDGLETARLSLSRCSGQNVEVAGAVRARLRRGWGAGYRLVGRGGTRLRREGGAWMAALPGETEDRRIEVRRGWAPLHDPRLGGRLDNW